jgi:hypothetical protein
MSDTSNGSKSGLLGRLSEANWVEPVLGALVAIFGIMAAWAAYNSGIYGGNSAEAYFIALKDLTAANDAYSFADRTLNTDNNVISEYFIQSELGVSEDTLSLLFRSLSEEGDAAWERFEANDDAEDFLDEQYYDEIYGHADDLADNSNKAFKIAKEWDDLGDAFDFLVLLVGLGLGFAAWASLLNPMNPVRYLFGVMALVLLVYCSYQAYKLGTTPVPADISAMSLED